MRQFLLMLFGVSAVLCPNVLTAEAKQGESPELTLPESFYAVPGVEMSVYFDNVVLTQNPRNNQFEVTCDIGQTDDRRWKVTPRKQHVGKHDFSLTVKDSAGRQLATASSTLHVVPADAGSTRSIRLLIVGDSLTHATVYPNEIARLLSRPGNPQWTMLGTHKTKQAETGVAHEGYGGWTWQRFASHYEPNPDGTYRKRSSPFVYPNGAEKPHLDVSRYVKEECDGKPPDFVIIMLGINDCFSAPPDDPQGIDSRIEAMFGHAKKLLKAIRQAAPRAEIGICLTTPPNSRESAFQANYQERYHRWGWKRIQHRLVQRQIEYFGSQQSKKQFLVPTELNLDPVAGYPDNNAVHPNTSGYRQIGASIFAWLKSRLATAGDTPN
jgi:lysophospholipase L1-like esterase